MDVLSGVVLMFCFFFQAEDGIRDDLVTGVQTCALPIFDKNDPNIARDLVMGNVGIILVDVNPFLDDGLIVGMQGKAAGVERTGASQAARLHFEKMVTAIPFGIDPLAPGITEEAPAAFDGDARDVVTVMGT